jgi:hypothetical protein
MKLIDLSGYFTVEPDIGQERWDRAPDALKWHFMQAFAHAAGLAENPGEYVGPPPEQFEEED